jgi:hypothetical protein
MTVTCRHPASAPDQTLRISSADGGSPPSTLERRQEPQAAAMTFDLVVALAIVKA